MTGKQQPDNKFDRIDHIVWIAPDLTDGIKYITETTGLEPVYGGRHLKFGTHNALLKIGPRCYFEILAPDPANKTVMPPRWMGVDLIDQPRIARWALNSNELESDVQKIGLRNSTLAHIDEGQRVTASGDVLSWQLSIPAPQPACESIPFLIDWQDSIHPATQLDHEGHLIHFRITDPHPERISHLLDELGCPVEVVAGPDTTLEVTLKTPLGIVSIT